MAAHRVIISPDHERWAEASAVLRMHGVLAELFVAERIGELALSGDDAGVARWKAIAFKIDALRTTANA